MDETQPTPTHADAPEQLAPTAQPAGAGMVSPDGLWRWDGTTWVPTGGDPHTAPGRPPVRDARKLAQWTVGAFAIVVITNVVLLIAAFGRLDIVNRALNGDIPSESEAVNSDDFVRLAAFLVIAAAVITAIIFLTWLYRVVANNRALALRHLRFSPGWAVGWWFVPFADLVMPYKVLVENWKATDPEITDAQPHQPPSGRTPALVVAWWIGVLATVVLRAISASQSGDSLQQLHDSTVTVMVATVVGSVIAVLAALVALRLTGRQKALVARVRGASQAA